MAIKQVTLSVVADAKVPVFTDKGTGETAYLEVGKLSPEMLGTIIREGALRVLRDGTGGKDKAEADKLAAVRKRLDAWELGSWGVVTRAGRIDTLMREAFRAELERQLGAQLTDAAWLDFQRKSLADAKMKAPPEGRQPSIDDLLRARAAVKAMKASGGKAVSADVVEGIYEAMVERFTEAANAIAVERAKAIAKVDVSGIDI